MSGIHKSNSYPERLKDAHDRHIREEKGKLDDELKVTVQTLDQFREKDHARAEHFAKLGSPSSVEVIIHIDWRARCCNSVSRAINFFLEREEETRRVDDIIRKKSYAGFYYFIKWFVRALFFLIFTTLGTIAGKEIGCEIKDHDACESGVVELADNSPHIVASIVGSLCGLILGQWVGRIIWDKMTLCVRRCLRKLEKKADKTKAWLIVTSIVVYVIVTGAFASIFFFFVDLDQDDENIIGAVVGGCIGLLLSSCSYGQVSETPMVHPDSARIDPPVIIV
jgi:hypothetical protein